MCREVLAYDDEYRRPWIFDCADAFDSKCVPHHNVTGVGCEGPVVGERQCSDGVDDDDDGDVDCADDDCVCE